MQIDVKSRTMRKFIMAVNAEASVATAPGTTNQSTEVGMTVGELIQQLKAADENAEIVISDISSDGIVLDINGEPFRITIPVC